MSKRGRYISVVCIYAQLTVAVVGSAAPTSAPASNPVAVIDGTRTIYLSEVDELLKTQLYEFEQRIYVLRKNALDKLILDAVLEREAKSQNASVDEIRQRLVPERVEVPQAKVDQEYAENPGEFEGKTEPEAKMRIRLELEARERLERYQSNLEALRKKADVQVSLAKPEAPRVIFAQSKLARGREDAAVTVVEFSDFQCPYCRNTSTTLQKLVHRYGDNVRIIFKHLPLSIHPSAFKAAQASVCAAEQGRFWDYHDRVFSTGELSPPALIQHAQQLAMDLQRFEACLGSETSAEVVRADMREASRIGVRGTPTFFVNGVRVDGGHGVEELGVVIDEYLKSQPKSALQSTGHERKGENHARQ